MIAPRSAHGCVCDRTRRPMNRDSLRGESPSAGGREYHLTAVPALPESALSLVVPTAATRSPRRRHPWDQVPRCVAVDHVQPEVSMDDGSGFHEDLSPTGGAGRAILCCIGDGVGFHLCGPLRRNSSVVLGISHIYRSVEPVGTGYACDVVSLDRSEHARGAREAHPRSGDGAALVCAETSVG